MRAKHATSSVRGFERSNLVRYASRIGGIPAPADEIPPLHQRTRIGLHANDFSTASLGTSLHILRLLILLRVPAAGDRSSGLASPHDASQRSSVYYPRAAYGPLLLHSRATLLSSIYPAVIHDGSLESTSAHFLFNEDIALANETPVHARWIFQYDHLRTASALELEQPEECPRQAEELRASPKETSFDLPVPVGWVTVNPCHLFLANALARLLTHSVCRVTTPLMMPWQLYRLLAKTTIFFRKRPGGISTTSDDTTDHTPVS